MPHDPHEKIVLSDAERAIVDKAVTANLFDPYSAHIEDVTSGRDLAKPGVVTFCGQLNAKNRMGGYVGARPFYGNLRDGKVVFLLVDGAEENNAALNCLGFLDSVTAGSNVGHAGKS